MAAPKDHPPFDVDARIIEEDTFRVLSAEPEVKAPRESLDQMIDQAHEIRPEKPGSVLVRNVRPLELIAIIHDLDREPTWDAMWQISALDGVLREVAVRQVRSLALPLLGTSHGLMGIERAAGFIRNAFRQNLPDTLKQIWLILPPDIDSKDLETIQAIIEEHPAGE